MYIRIKKGIGNKPRILLVGDNHEIVPVGEPREGGVAAATKTAERIINDPPKHIEVDTAKPKKKK